MFGSGAPNLFAGRLPVRGRMLRIVFVYSSRVPSLWLVLGPYGIFIHAFVSAEALGPFPCPWGCCFRAVSLPGLLLKGFRIGQC